MIPGQPQTRTRARPSIGTRGEGPRGGQECTSRAPAARSAPHRRRPWRPWSGRRRPAAPAGDRAPVGLERALERRRRRAPDRRAWGPVETRRRRSPALGRASWAAASTARSRAWSYPRSASRRRASGTQVTTSVTGSGPAKTMAPASAAAHAAPPRELQPVDGPPGRPRERERRARRRHGAAVGSPGRSGTDSGHGRPHRSHQGGASTVRSRRHAVAERPGPAAAPRASPREDHIQRPFPHGPDPTAGYRHDPTAASPRGARRRPSRRSPIARGA